MLVKVKFKDILAQTNKAILFLISEEEVWFPKKHFRFLRQGAAFICPLWLAQEKMVKYTSYIHFPEKIDPVYNQEPIDELRFDSSRRC